MSTVREEPADPADPANPRRSSRRVPPIDPLPDLVIAPSGHLHADRYPSPTAESASLDPRSASALRSAFDEGTAAGLFALVSPELFGASLPPSLAFGRDLSRAFLSAVAALPDLEDLRDGLAVTVSADAVAALLESAPPMRGGEYLSAETLGGAFEALLTRFRERLRAHPGTVQSYLATFGGAFSLTGRVCFHLAENKESEETPFAFLATFAHRTAGERARHLPLSRALETYERSKDKLLSLLVPVHKAAEKSAVVRALVESGELYHPLAWTAEEAHQFLSEIPLYESSGIVVRVPDWWKKKRAVRPEVEVRIGAQKGGLDKDALLDFDVAVSLDGAALSAKERAAILAARSSLVLLRGQWVEIDAQKLKEVLRHWESVREANRAGIGVAEALRLLAGVSLEGDLDAGAPSETREWSRVVAASELRAALERLRDPGATGAADPGTSLKAELRPYQRVGVRWLHLLDQLGLGGCLADDMGLGKTIQVIALLLLKKRAKEQRPSLLVVPASLIANWKAELDRFAPSLRAVIAHSSVMAPEALGAIDPQRLPAADVFITTYGSLQRFDWLGQVEWSVVVLDEAQAIKNPGTKQARAAKALKSRTRLALTGTPIENRLGDLWSLFDFLSPGLLGRAQSFARFVRRIESGQGGYGPLRELVRPYILRRLKTDRRIIDDLPEKTEILSWCALSKVQATLYEESVRSLREELTQVDGIRRRGVVLSYLLRFKQICNHPSQWLGDGVYATEESGKLTRLAELAEEIASRQEKMLVFTQFKEMTEPLARFLEPIFGRPGLVLHGQTRVADRRGLVDAFQDDAGPPFFVLSVKAGGTGLNLTAASHVVHYDRWWNPAVEDQATDRAHRIGQRRAVMVHKLVCRGTVEERIDALIAGKRGLAGEVLRDGAEAVLTELDDDALLKMVALDLDRALKEEV
ncbi:MAG: DEAD/DEAH box helicase [Deltaproteobacteria bacterium]|nr:DEAD/DEAH box helicase [Deltaproteobacteria bacterium]